MATSSSPFHHYPHLLQSDPLSVPIAKTNHRHSAAAARDHSSSIVTDTLLLLHPDVNIASSKKRSFPAADLRPSPTSEEFVDFVSPRNGKRKSKTKKVKKEERKGETGGYIHVRARRGQATDSHSLAERVRREKISERMKFLQSLVPGCDKVTGKALMLDEIINYVQSLQTQVELLSMKLASVNPTFYDFGMDIESFMVQSDQDLLNLGSLEHNLPQTFSTFQQPVIPPIFHQRVRKPRM
ncbi:hypothetical protein M569_04585 [Genlisea aurea]|uniref:BHLH domain-containing protein n=1 Tax=Genlisea aurea TaxID=192259 RepID=S8CYS7_9LAMI|nr:hypothetical protein M569_04585 [Genlisea aurea]